MRTGSGIVSYISRELTVLTTAAPLVGLLHGPNVRSEEGIVWIGRKANADGSGLQSTAFGRNSHDLENEFSDRLGAVGKPHAFR